MSRPVVSQLFMNVYYRFKGAGFWLALLPILFQNGGLLLHALVVTIFRCDGILVLWYYGAGLLLACKGAEWPPALMAGLPENHKTATPKQLPLV